MPFGGLIDSIVAIPEKVTATRRNHAVEHAAVAVLLERSGFTRSIAGRSNSGGFNIFGNLSSEELQSAVDEGLARMQQGEGALAISPFCGTNLAVTGILAAIFTTLFTNKREGRMQQFPNIVVGGILAAILAQPIGRLAQQYLTTSPDVDSLTIKEIKPAGWGPFKSHRVETSQ